MRQLGRLACLAFAGLFVVSALEAQNPAAAKAPAKAASGAPKIEVVPETKDAGTVAKGNVVDATFVVRNTGGADLVISDARPSCGCTVASFDRVIKPGAEGKIKSSVDTKSFSGPISKSIVVHSNDPERPQMNLFIKAMVKPFVDVLPQAFFRFSVIKGDPAGQDVILLSEEKGFRPRSEEHTSELQSQSNLVCRLLLEKKHMITPATDNVPMPSADVEQIAAYVPGAGVPGGCVLNPSQALHRHAPDGVAPQSEIVVPGG